MRWGRLNVRVGGWVASWGGGDVIKVLYKDGDYFR